MKPVVVLIEALTYPPLLHLARELDAIEEHLASMGRCEVVTVRGATLDDVGRQINDPATRERVCIVHYAGHADGQGLYLETETGDPDGRLAFIGGLAKIFRTLLPNIRLVFLNGCNTSAHALALLKEGLPLVIATSEGIKDEAASSFAEYFYQGLALENSVVEAMAFAEGSLEAAAGEDRPWAIYGPHASRTWQLFGVSEADRRELDEYLGRAVLQLERRTHQRVTSRAAPGQPYKFLYAFDIEDAEIFFGRESAIEKLHAVMLRDRLTILHARSGAGKTSLLQAGLGSRLIGEGRLPIFARIHRDPLESIKRVIAPVSLGPWPKMLDDLSLSELLTGVGRALSRRTTEMVLVLDQFEELFIFSESAESRRVFLEELAACYDDKELPVRIVIGIRKDYFSDLGEWEERVPTLFHNEYRLQTMTRSEAEAAIVEPLKRVDPDVSYERELIEKLLADLDLSGMQLPHLQLLCTRLYELRKGASLTLEAYEALGGAAGLLASYLHQTLAELKPEDRDLALMILGALISSEGTRRPLGREELGGRVKAPAENMEEVLRRLVGARLLQMDEASGRTVYELAHDYLAAEVRRSIEVPPTGEQMKVVGEALLDAFVSSSDLERMVLYELNEDMRRIVPEDDTLRHQVFRLVRHWAAQPKGLKRLIDGARHENPGNRLLAQVAETFADFQFATLPLVDPSAGSSLLVSDVSTSEVRDERLRLLCVGLLEVFRRLSDLEMFLRFEFDLVLSHIVATSGRNLTQVVTQLIDYFSKRGQLTALVETALSKYPDNPALAAAAAQFRGEPSAPNSR